MKRTIYNVLVLSFVWRYACVVYYRVMHRNDEYS